jgi:hypothetical protein
MDLVTALRLMARRWMVVVPVLILTAVAVVVGASKVAPSFQARASVLVLPLASESTGPTGANPYSDYGGQRLAVSHLVSLADSASFAREVVGRDEIGTFELTPQADVGLIDIVVTGPSSAETLATMERLIVLLETSLGNLQQEINAPADTWVEMRRLDNPEEAVQLAGSRNRVVVAISAVGVLAAVGAAFAVEGMAGRRDKPERKKRRGKRERSRSDGPDPGLGGDHDHDDHDVLTRPGSKVAEPSVAQAATPPADVDPAAGAERTDSGAYPSGSRTAPEAVDPETVSRS